MPTLETIFLLLLLLCTVVGTFWLVSSFQRRDGGAAQRSLEQGDFEAALAAAGSDADPTRAGRMTGAVAAKHLLRFDEAERWLATILAEDPRDGEAMLEAGLVAAYGGRAEIAMERFDRALALRADLAEPVALHRAWCQLRHGERSRALALFEEIEAPLENKLRVDLGTGDAEFAEWFLQAAALWRERGPGEAKAEWAAAAGRGAAPASRLAAVIDPRGEPSTT